MLVFELLYGTMMHSSVKFLKVGNMCHFCFYIYSMALVLQMWSNLLSVQVTGELLDNLSCWDALRAVLPVGTVSGAPKVWTLYSLLVWGPCIHCALIRNFSCHFRPQTWPRKQNKKKKHARTDPWVKKHLCYERNSFEVFWMNPLLYNFPQVLIQRKGLNSVLFNECVF
jgi:hypothetical protein